MRLGLSHAVKIKACLDPVQTALQSFSIGPVDPGKTIERRHGWRESTASLDSRRGNDRLTGRLLRLSRSAIAQRPHVANRFLP